jgi:hypothetical protein
MIFITLGLIRDVVGGFHMKIKVWAALLTMTILVSSCSEDNRGINRRKDPTFDPSAAQVVDPAGANSAINPLSVGEKEKVFILDLKQTPVESMLISQKMP